MYVCICHAITQDQVHEAIAEGAESVKELRQQLKVTTCCGSCLENIKGCLRQTNTTEAA